MCKQFFFLFFSDTIEISSIFANAVPSLSYFTIIRMGVSLLIQIPSFLVPGQCTETFALVSFWVLIFLFNLFLQIMNLLTILCFDLGEGGHVVCYEMDDIERQLGFGRNSLVIYSFACHVPYQLIVPCIGTHNIGTFRFLWPFFLAVITLRVSVVLVWYVSISKLFGKSTMEGPKLGAGLHFTIEKKGQNSPCTLDQRSNWPFC